MNKEKVRNNGMKALRKRAEEKISNISQPEELSADEARRLVHELRVHQIELEMQNDALLEAQAELVESNSRFSDLYNFAPVGYLTIDESSNILEANLTLTRQLGVERSKLIGRSFLTFIAPDAKEPFRIHLAGIFRNEQSGSLETRLIKKAGAGEFFAQLESIYAEDGRGRRQCRISVTDISERKKAEETAGLYMKKLERSNRELQDFAFIASHDLQEPLRKIQAFGTMLEETTALKLDDESRDYLERMMKAAKRMSDMIRGLLEYSRVGSRHGAFETVELSRVVREVESDLEIQAERSGARIEIGPLPVIEADINQMRQLFQNLLSNALKFHGEEKPRIKIYARSPGDVSERPQGGGTHLIFIEDNGIGFDEKYVERIFTLFERLHGRTDFEGTGMGLAICRRIVEHHHGSITARSKPGRGATFIITLPDKQSSEE